MFNWSFFRIWFGLSTGIGIGFDLSLGFGFLVSYLLVLDNQKTNIIGSSLVL
jgi:hypothetical protein